MANDAEGPVPQADGDPAEQPILRNHTICLIDTDENGLLNMKVDLPEGQQVNLVGDIAAFAYLTGKLNRFLGGMLETSSWGILEKRKMLARKEEN